MGKTLKEAQEITNKQIVKILILLPTKIHCSIIAKEAIEKAIEDYEEKNGKELSN